MPWNANWPDGTQSVKDNRTPGNQNTTYIKTTMNRDHFWDIGTDEDGRHQYVNMPKNESGGSPADPSVGTGMDGIYYIREKTSSEAPTAQRSEPFVKTSGTTDEILQLGSKCLVNFTVSGSSANVRYQHNVASVARNEVGLYTITFDQPLASNRYIVTGSAMLVTGSSTSDLAVSVRRAAAIGTSMSVNFVRVAFSDVNNGQKVDPGVAMIEVKGG